MQESPPKKAEGAKKEKAKRVEAKRPDVESSEWDTEDECGTYGPNTRRARRAAQKKVRVAAAAKAVKEVVGSIVAERKRAVDKGDRLSGEEKQAAAQRLAATACDVNAVDCCKRVAATTRPAEELRAPFHCKPEESQETPARNRPTRGVGLASAKASAAAVKKLLGG